MRDLRGVRGDDLLRHMSEGVPHNVSQDQGGARGRLELRQVPVAHVKRATDSQQSEADGMSVIVQHK